MLDFGDTGIRQPVPCQGSAVDPLSSSAPPALGGELGSGRLGSWRTGSTGGRAPVRRLARPESLYRTRIAAGLQAAPARAARMPAPVAQLGGRAAPVISA